VSAVVLIYDADCAFCQSCVELGRRLLTDFPDAVGFQHADLGRYALSREQAGRSVYLVQPGRVLQHGAGAIAAILLGQPGFWWRVAGGVMTVPPVNWLAALGYRLVSRYRHRLPGSTAACRVVRGP
jgi:predicted DCC family thiol-disulfide oxidoreductase YuxK